MKRPVIDPKKSYTFSDYFEMNIPIDELVTYFGYHYQLKFCTLPRSTVSLDYFAHLEQQIKSHLEYVYLTSETARREVLVAPILFNAATFLKTTVYIEYPLQVSHQLKGKIDYYLRRQDNSNLLIVEAKHDDMTRGFTQLAVELIALDQWLDDSDKPLYGIITMGNVWQFGILDRLSKQIIQDIRLYRVPDDIEDLLRILIAILAD